MNTLLTSFFGKILRAGIATGIASLPLCTFAANYELTAPIPFHADYQAPEIGQTTIFLHGVAQWKDDSRPQIHLYSTLGVLEGIIQDPSTVFSKYILHPISSFFCQSPNQDAKAMDMIVEQISALRDPHAPYAPLRKPNGDIVTF